MHSLLIEKDVGALLMRVWQTTLTPGVDITPAGLLIAAQVIISALISSLIAGVTLRIIDDRFKTRDAARVKAAELEKSEQNEDSSNQKILVSLARGTNRLARAMIENNAAQAQERKEIRTMLETKQEAKDGRESVTKAINDHTDAALETEQKAINANTDAKIGEVIGELEKLRNTSITQKALDDSITPLVEKIDVALREWRVANPPVPVSHNGSSEPPSTSEAKL